MKDENKKKKEGWINIYRKSFGPKTCGTIFSSKEEAYQFIIKSNNYITTIKIEWEE